jgi:signal transduction histidine kinase
LLGFIVDEVDRLTQVVNNLLGLARFAPPKFKPVAVQDLLSSMLARWRKSDDHNPHVAINCECNHSETILADRQQLVQVFMNLIRNSEEALPNGGRIDIKVAVDRQNDGIIINIRDSGPGVAPEEVEKLWQNFYTTKQEGVGLGLSVCKQIIQAHSGEIEIVGAENCGFCITIRLPLRPEYTISAPVKGYVAEDPATVA